MDRLGRSTGGAVVVADHDDAAAKTAPAQHFGRRKAGRAAADDDDLLGVSAFAAMARGFGCSRFCVTKMRPSRCSTVQQSIGLSAGARSASPVRRSKQA